MEVQGVFILCHERIELCGLPTICVNQEKAATVLDINYLDVGYSGFARMLVTSNTNRVSEMRSFVRGATPGGNSGSPVFLLVGNEPVFLGSKHLGSRTEDRWCAFACPAIIPRIDALQSQINSWERGNAAAYQIQAIDISAFNRLSKGGDE